jgi:hypothetical protein
LRGHAGHFHGERAIGTCHLTQGDAPKGEQPRPLPRSRICGCLDSCTGAGPSQEAALRRAASRRGPRDAACMARATRSAPSRWPGAPGSSSRHGWTCAVATLAPSGPGSAARSPSPASLRSCSPPAPTSASQACAPTAPGTLLPPDSARAEPTPPRSRPCSGMPQSKLRPGTSEPGQPRTPKSSSASSATSKPLTSPLPLSGLLLPPQVIEPGCLTGLSGGPFAYQAPSPGR